MRIRRGRDQFIGIGDRFETQIEGQVAVTVGETEHAVKATSLKNVKPKSSK